MQFNAALTMKLLVFTSCMQLFATMSATADEFSGKVILCSTLETTITNAPKNKFRPEGRHSVKQGAYAFDVDSGRTWSRDIGVWSGSGTCPPEPSPFQYCSTQVLPSGTEIHSFDGNLWNTRTTHYSANQVDQWNYSHHLKAGSIANSHTVLLSFKNCTEIPKELFAE